MLRKPRLGDEPAIEELIRNCSPLPCNTPYDYHTLCAHHADTCVIAEQHRRIIGFLSGHIRPDEPDTLMICQVAVDASARGKDIAQLMLSAVSSRPENASVKFVQTAISPDSQASRALFDGFARRRDTRLEARSQADQANSGSGRSGTTVVLRIGPIKHIKAA